MRSTLSTIVALTSSLQVASAGWTNAPSFSCPANTNNQCNTQQSSGFDWSGLNFGSFSKYGGLNFGGFSCASAFGGGSKRDSLSKRTFQNTCITGKAHSDVSSCPSFGCGSSSDVSAFSVNELQISVEFDCDLEFHYSMPGGSTCKQTHSCSSGGSVVKNTQCGGAKNVTVVYPSQSSGSGKGKSSCSIGVHSIGFDCSSASSTKYHSTSTPVKATTSIPTLTTSSTKEIETTPSSSPAASTSTPKQAETTSSVYVTESSPAASTSTPKQVETTSSVYVTESSPAVSPPTTPASSSVVEVITTVVVDTTTTLCPVTKTHTFGNGTSVEISTSTSTILLTTTKTVCTRCEAESTTSPAGIPGAVSTSSAVNVPTTITTSSGPITTATCPDVLPQCLNTWLFIEGCSSNTDTDCFCKSTEFVTNIFSCLSAYGASDNEISLAQTYFQGICAPYIPSNPAIVTCASSVTATVSQTAVPVTTITVQTTAVVPCTETTGVSSGYPIPSSYTTATISTVVTVPQVVFATVGGTSSADAVLVTGAPTTGNAGVALSTATPAQPTYGASGISNSTIQASSTPTQQTTSSAGKNNIAIGASFAALFFAVLIL
ncbi:adhesin protein Mad1 [Hyaloscypha sp. PMI_1271]|nr:adhesin protein Mad1 [Hyaloscypha sp. PMI_1271]